MIGGNAISRRSIGVKNDDGAVASPASISPISLMVSELQFGMAGDTYSVGKLPPAGQLFASHSRSEASRDG